MAERDIFSRLQRLFSTNVIVRNVGGRKLKIADTAQVQSIAGKDLVDRFSRLYKSPSGMSGYNQSLYQKTMRMGLFRDYEAMDSDPLISSALDIYADETTLKSEYGKILTIKSDNNQIHDILHNLYYDILNIEFNLYPWTRNLCKYGDFFLKLDINEKYGITNVEPLSSYDVQRVEGEDPENPYYTKFVLESGDVRQTQQGAKTEFENYEIAHFRMISDSNFLPYGRSMLEGGRKVWKQLSLMEDAMLIHRIMRAPEKRIFNIDIGNIPPAEVDQYMQKIVGKMKKAPVIDENGQYNLKYNIQNITEDFFLPVRGGDSGTRIENLSGLEYQTTDDIEYLRNKLLASLKIPQPYYGYAEKASESKATLAAEDVRFARTIERIQRIMVSELTKIGIVHLYSQGYTDQDLVNFDLELTNPSKIYEQEKLELLGQRITAFNDLTAENSVTPKEWAYKQIFGFSDDEIKSFEEKIVEDKITEFRYESIKTEGNDPKQAAEQEQQEGEEELASRTGTEEIGEEGGSPEGGWEGAGRPKEMPHYGKDGSARGRDPLGNHERKKLRSSSPRYGKAYRESLGLDKLKSKVDKKIINEAEDVDTEYKNEVSSSLNDN
jgi:hypothetical protein